MDNNIAIVTDSTSDLTADKIENTLIYCIPLNVIFDDQTQFKDRVEITPKQVYDNLDEKTPTTSMPSPQQFKEKYNKLKEKGYDKIISIHLSSNLSGTYNTAKTVSQLFDDIQIEVIDSRNTSMAMGRLVLYTNQLIKKGYKFTDVITKVKENIKNINFYVVIETLKYLKRGGRIGKIAGTVGEILNIKPIVSINKKGELYTYDKNRGRSKSIKKLIKLVNQEINDDLYNVDVMHTNSREDAQKVLNKIKGINNINHRSVGELGPVIGVHTGPGLIGVCISKFN